MKKHLYLFNQNLKSGGHCKIFVVYILDAGEQETVRDRAGEVQGAKSHGDDSGVSPQRNDSY